MSAIAVLSTIAAVHLLAAASPGPNMIVVVSHAVSGSRLSGIQAGIGVLLGTLIWATATAFGLGALVSNAPSLYGAIQFAGAAYLVWLGCRMIAAAWKNDYDDAQYRMMPKKPGRAIVLEGFLVNMTNPKTIAYYTSLFAVLIPANAPDWMFFAAVATAMTVTLCWWTIVATVFSSGLVRRCFAATRRYLDVIMGGALILLGLRLASSR